MSLNVLSIVRKFIYRISHGRKGNITTQGWSSTAGHFLSPWNTILIPQSAVSWDLSERRERGVRAPRSGGSNRDACVLLRVTALGTLGHLQTLTGLSPVSGMWPWDQVCTLAMHKEQRYQKHTEYTEYLILGVFLLRRPSLTQTNLKGRSHHYTNNNASRHVSFWLGLPWKQGNKLICLIGLRTQWAACHMLALCSVRTVSAFAIGASPWRKHPLPNISFGVLAANNLSIISHKINRTY